MAHISAQSNGNSATSSPRLGPVDLSDCMEELLKFTLERCIDDTLEIDLGISNSYCLDLLKDDPDGPPSSSIMIGVPAYPLYKHLASTLMECICSGSFYRAENMLACLPDASSFSPKQEWDDLILEKGSQLVNILKSIVFDLHVQEPFFSQLRSGLKTVEGRCNSGDYSRIKAGDLILFNRSIVFEVQDIHPYPSFSVMLETMGLPKVLPGVRTTEEGVQIYRKFYTEEKEKLNGVLGICVSRSSHQPYLLVASMLSGLNYEGIRSLLGLARTASSVVDGLPPPRSSLLSSFASPNKPDLAAQID